MRKQYVLFAMTVVALFVMSPTAFSAESNLSPAKTKGPQIKFWQSNFLYDKGYCMVEFTFDSVSIKDPIENITVTVEVLNSKHYQLGEADFNLDGPLTGGGAGRYAKGMFEGLEKWPGIDDGLASPVCYKGTRLVIKKAIGKQNGNTVDLVKLGLLKYVRMEIANVSVGK